MDSELNFNEENPTYPTFNGTNHPLMSSHPSTDQHHALHGGPNLPWHMAEPGVLRRSASWGPYQHTDDWSSRGGTPLSRMGSQSTSYFSGDISQSSLHRELEQAKQTILVLETKLDTMTKAFTTVVGAVPSLLNVANPLGQKIPLSLPGSALGVLGTGMEQKSKPLCQSDYPDIKFWHEAQWKTYSTIWRVKMVKQYQALAVRAREIREVAFTLWFEMLEKGRAPAKWSEAAADVKNFYYLGIEERCPEMHYCHNSWKAQHLATKNYLSFHNNHGHKGVQGIIKQEQSEQTKISDNAKPGAQKRSHSSDGEEEKADKGTGVKKTKRAHHDQDDKPNALTATATPASTSCPPHSTSFKHAPSAGGESSSAHFINQSLSSTGNKAADSSNDTVAALQTSSNPPTRPISISRILFSNPPLPPPPSPATATTTAAAASLSPDSHFASEPAQSIPGTFGLNRSNLTNCESANPMSTTPSLTTTGAHDTAAPPSYDATPSSHNATRPSHDAVAPAPTQDMPTPAPLPSSVSAEAAQSVPEQIPPPEHPLPLVTVAATRKSAKVEPITPRNMCKREWLATNPSGSNAEFATYWNSLKGSAEEGRFQQQARDAKAAAAEEAAASSAAAGTANSSTNTNKAPKTRKSRAT